LAFGTWWFALRVTRPDPAHDPLLLAYLDGILTIVSHHPARAALLVFARADRPFLRNGLPMLAGMALTFAGVATLAAVAGGWAVAANEYGRAGALVLLAVFGVTLLMPRLSERLTRPLVALGARLSQSAEGADETSLFSAILLGVAVGLLWAPCAGPVLGVILTGAALQGASFETTLLLLTYAAGAATSLALALLVGGRVLTAMKRSLRAGEWVRRGLGACSSPAVGCIARTRYGLRRRSPPPAPRVSSRTAFELRGRTESPATVDANPTGTMQAKPVPQARPLKVRDAPGCPVRSVAELTAVDYRGLGKDRPIDFGPTPASTACVLFPRPPGPRSTRSRAWSGSACTRLNSPSRRASTT
jgi:cytochrome c biogenesis protein CcdA